MIKYRFLLATSWAIFLIKFPIRLTLFCIVRLGEFIEKYDDIICYPESALYRAANTEYYNKTGKHKGFK